MEVMKDLAAAVQLCFAVFSLPADLHRTDVTFIGEIGSQLQPLLLRLQKAALQSEPVTSDHKLLAATASVRSALQGLQEAGGRCRVRHWLLRVLVSKDVRVQLTGAIATMADALQELNTATVQSIVAEELPDSQSHTLQQLQHCVATYKVTRHEALETLARGLLKHITDDRLDEEQLPSMLKYVVKQAALQTQHKSRASSSNSVAEGNSDGSSSNGASSSKRTYDQIPAGESSLTDTELLMVLEQMAASKKGTEQLALYQILSTVEGLQEAKRHEQREHYRRKMLRRQQPQQQSPLPRVSESGDQPADAVSATPVGQDAATPGQAAGIRGAVVAENQSRLNISEVVSAMMAQLEEMLLQDPWDTAALTQLLELLLHVESVNNDSSTMNGTTHEPSDDRSKHKHHQQQRFQHDAQQHDDQDEPHGNKKGKWWNMGAAAKAALQSCRTPSSNTAAAATSKPRQQRDLTEAQIAQKAAWAERVRVLAAAALDVLLHLTPRPARSSSFLPMSPRPGVCTEAGNSLALPLMAHADAVPALSACVWSSWPDVCSKAAQLLAILIQSGSAMEAAGDVSGLPEAAASAYVRFCKHVCSTVNADSAGASPQHGGVWYGLATQLYSNNHATAGAAAEALAAIGGSRVTQDMCSSLAATQQARALLLLLSRCTVHNAAGGAAAAALYALSDPKTRPALHQILANSFWQELPQSVSHGAGERDSLGEVLLQMMGCKESLTAVRVARLTASLAHAIGWQGRAEAWVNMFKAGQYLLAEHNTSNHGGALSSSVVRACGAELLVQLMGSRHEPADADSQKRRGLQAQQHVISPMLAAGVDPTEQEELLFEALQLCVQQFSLSGSWEGLIEVDEQEGRNKGGEGVAALRLLCTLFSWLPEDAKCAMPDMYIVVMPVLEHLSATQHGALLWEARRTHELLLAELVGC